MARGDHHSTDRALSFDSEGDGRRWRGGWRKDDLETVCGEDLRGAASEGIREESAIVTDDHFLFGAWGWISEPISGGGLSDTLNVGKREILGNNRPPTVGSELDCRHLSRLRIES